MRTAKCRLEVANMKQVITFHLLAEKKHSVRYKAEGDSAIISDVYVKKENNPLFKDGYPPDLILTVNKAPGE